MHQQQFTFPEQDTCLLDVYQRLLIQPIESQEVTNGARDLSNSCNPLKQPQIGPLRCLSLAEICCLTNYFFGAGGGQTAGIPYGDSVWFCCVYVNELNISI